MSRHYPAEEAHDFSNDFWPGFVDILSGLILIFSFLILVAGVVIAVTYQVNSTVKIPPEPFRYILNTIQQSALTIESKYDVIEKVKQGQSVQTLIQTTQQELENIGEKTHKVTKNFPDLKRRLTQEINFLQEELRKARLVPTPRGQTQSNLTEKAGKTQTPEPKYVYQPRSDWETLVNKDNIVINFASPSAEPPTPQTETIMRNAVTRWLSLNQISAVSIIVRNADTTFPSIAQRDSLRRALFMRNMLKQINNQLSIKITSVPNDRDTLRFGWMELRSQAN